MLSNNTICKPHINIIIENLTQNHVLLLEPMTMAAYDIPQIHVKDDFKEMFYDDVVTSVNGNGGSDSDDSYIDMKDEDEKGKWYSKQSQSHNISNELSDVMKKKPQKKITHQKKTSGQISSFNGKAFPTAIPPRPNKPPGKQGYGMVMQMENISSSLPNYNRQYQPEYPPPNSLVNSLRDQRTEGRHYEELPDLNGAVRQVKSPPPPPRNIRSPFSPPYSLLSTQPGVPSSASLPTVDVNNTTLTSSLPLQPIQDSGNTRPPSEEFFASSDEMTLGEFVSKHQDEFPVRVRVSRGFYGTSDKWSISEGEYFNIHFVKYTKVVGATDALFGHYTIPLNSSVEFGVFYAPHGNIDAAFTGYEFKTIGDVLKANPVPLAVKATMNWGKDKTGFHSVTNGDVLALRESKGRFKHSLKCIDCFTGKQKSLSYSCAGFFTTCPFELRLYLPEVVQHFSLPQPFAMFINTTNNPDLPQNLSTRRVKLTGCSIETSLIATQLDSRISTTTESSPLIEIPIDLDIGVQLVTPKEEEVAQLYEETGHLFSTIDITRLQTIPNIDTMPSDPLAAEALAACHQSRINIGVEIQQPPRYSVRKSIHPYQANPQYTNEKDKKQSNNKSKRNGSDQFNERILATELDIQRIDSSFSQQIKGIIYITFVSL